MNEARFLKCLFMLACAGLLTRHPELLAQNAGAEFHWPNGKRVAVSLSFDDARASQVDVGVPLFDRYASKVTFFVNPPNMKKRLEAWKRAAANGYEIGNHTTSHPCTGNFAWSRDNALENYSPTMIEEQMDGANAEIERLVGVKALTFAYPCGQKFIGRGVATQSYVPLVARRFLVGRGFRDEAANDPRFCDLAQVLGVESDGMSFDQMKSAVVAAAQEGRWLVFAGHEIGAPGNQTTLVSSLEQFLLYTNDPANGVWLNTVEKIASYIRARRSDR